MTTRASDWKFFGDSIDPILAASVLSWSSSPLDQLLEQYISDRQ